MQVVRESVIASGSFVITHNEVASKYPNVFVLTSRVALLHTPFNGRAEAVSGIDWPR
jgi:hypothetical protein